MKVDVWAMKWSSPEYPGYADIGNHWYAAVFKDLWGKSHICSYSDATIGVHVEALLGWFIYLSSHPGFEFEERVHDTSRPAQPASGVAQLASNGRAFKLFDDLGWRLGSRVILLLHTN